MLLYCNEQSAWLRETIEALVRHESPSTDKTAVDRCGDELARRLREIGARVERLDSGVRGAHLRAAFGEGAPQIMLLGHFDTVWDVGQIEKMPVREERGRLFGPGVFDMKAGIGVAMLAMRALREHARAHPRVVMLWTTDEEVGSGTSRALIEDEARRSHAVLVMEPSLPGGAAKTARKGCGEFTLRVHGVQAHAGIDPGKGASAIHELAHQIREIACLQDLDRGVSVNVGVVAGGTRPNVIASDATATIDVRVPTAGDAERLERALRGLAPLNPATRLELHGGVDRPPLERSEPGARLFALARDVARSLGADLSEGATGGGSDGNFTAAIGVPTLDGLGPQGDGAHALHEHVILADLPWRAAFLAELLNRAGAVQYR